MSRVHLRSGDNWVELESDEPLSVLEARAMALLKDLPQTTLRTSRNGQKDDIERSSDRPDIGQSGDFNESINTVVARLKADSGREILRAAAVHITLADGVATFSKADWLARAHSATEWKKTYSNAQATDIKRMIAADEIREKAGGTYAVSTKYLEQTRIALDGE